MQDGKMSNSKHVTFCFGRLNPPHYGHSGLIQAVKTDAQKHGGDWFIFTSKSHDKKPDPKNKNPIAYSEKIQWIDLINPGLGKHFVRDSSIAKTFLEAAAYLYSLGYTSATFVAGDEDMPAMKPALEQYNHQQRDAKGNPHRHGFYAFHPFLFHANPRVTSATSARAAAIANDPDAFFSATKVPKDWTVNGRTLLEATRAGLVPELAEPDESIPVQKKPVKQLNTVVPKEKVMKKGPAQELAESMHKHGMDAYERDHRAATSNMGVDHNFRNQERNAGLEHERNNIAISINGKKWKVFPGKGHADSHEEWKHLQHMKDWCAKKSASTGKKWSAHLTGENPTVSEGKTQKQEAPKPRNFVAKNAIQSGAGAHKDKKKAMKQGDTKHKGKLEFAEGRLSASLNSIFEERFEVLYEAEKIPDSHATATPGMTTHPSLDNSSPYHPWRFAANFLPGANGKDPYEHQPERDGPNGQHLVTVAYTSEEDTMIKQAEKAFGAEARRIAISPPGSTELPDTYKTSPVATPKRNKYGV